MEASSSLCISDFLHSNCCHGSGEGACGHQTKVCDMAYMHTACCKSAFLHAYQQEDTYARTQLLLSVNAVQPYLLPYGQALGKSWVLDGLVMLPRSRFHLILEGCPKEYICFLICISHFPAGMYRHVARTGLSLSGMSPGSEHLHACSPSVLTCKVAEISDQNLQVVQPSRTMHQASPTNAYYLLREFATGETMCSITRRPVSSVLRAVLTSHAGEVQSCRTGRAACPTKYACIHSRREQLASKVSDI